MKTKTNPKKSSLATKAKADRLNWKLTDTDKVVKLSDAKTVKFFNPFKRVWINLPL